MLHDGEQTVNRHAAIMARGGSDKEPPPSQAEVQHVPVQTHREQQVLREEDGDHPLPGMLHSSPDT